MSRSRLVLVTGASGSVGRALVPELQDRYSLRLQSRSRSIEPPGDTHEVVTGDIQDMEDARRMVAGADAVVHLAAAAKADSTWDEVRRPNLDGAWNIFEASRAANVRRVVFASTNHVMGMYDRDREWPIDPAQPVRPDGPYGASKAFGEALGRYFSDAFGLQVICLRIGWVLERPHDEQGLRMWLSPRDLGQLVRRSLEADVQFGVYYGVSANTRNKWKLDNARADLGYEPQDDSEVYAEQALAADG